MLKRKPSRSGAVGRGARARKPARRQGRPGPAKPETREVPAEVRAPNRPEWPDPLNEEELRALKAGWGFVE
ncbi:hypothetical protein GMJLKIPL_6436 [Methylobacterium isbiliense]|uniref:Uncharacterized protein n=1 Tax=Methylobacterium isbiliense TaxID=315478 RepID=A0ABQ4SMM1_9HYPH|nr:hypothetical protein GMJLKIPL_6436 [Methylobacterium isbiliense]